MVLPETYRKILIIVAMGLSNFSEAYIMGHTAGLIAGLYQEREELQITEEDISWIMSLMYSSMMFGTFLASVITEKIGRRLTVAVFMIPVIIHWFMLYFGRSVYIFMTARLLAGLGFGGALPAIYMATAECSSAKMRGFNLALITSVLPGLGGNLGGNLAIVLHWRTAALFGLVPAIFSAVLPIFCVESPPWLASKGRFDECEVAFTKLHGLKPSVQKELQQILEVEKTKLSGSDKSSNTIKIIFTRLKVAGTKWYFWKIMFLANAITIYKMICGRILFGTYGIIILQKLTGQTDILLYMLIISVISVAGSFLTPILLRKINMRSLLFPNGLLNVLLLLAVSIVLYIWHENYYDSSLLVWMNVSVYIIHMSVVSIVLWPILEGLPNELYPLEIRGVCNTIVAVIGTGFTFTFLKVTPAMFALVEIHGVFLINAVAMLGFILYLWLKLPETKGQTLHEIELTLKNEEYLLKGNIGAGEQTKELI